MTSLALDLSWSDLDTLTNDVAERITAQRVPDTIVGVMRGGIVPAVMLAHRLGVRDVRAVTAVRTVRDGAQAAKLAEPIVSAPTIGRLAGLDVLVVDDVAGSGRTLRSVTSLLAARTPERLRAAVMVVNVDNWVAGIPACPDPRGTYELIGTTCRGWVRFPWETACM